MLKLTESFAIVFQMICIISIKTNVNYNCCISLFVAIVLSHLKL